MNRFPTQRLRLGRVLFAVTCLGAASLPAQPAPRAMSLEQALELAEQRSEVVRIAQAQVMRARGQQIQARSAFLPQLNGTINYQRLLQSQFEEIDDRLGTDDGGGGTDSAATENPLARIFASPNTFTLGLSLEQPIFTGGRLLAQRRAAEAGRRAADVNLVSQRAQVLLTVTEAYYDAVLASRLATIAESTLVQTERTYRTTAVTREVGRTSEFELLRAQVARDNQRPLVIQARTQRRTALLRLKQLLEIPAQEPLELTTPLENPALPTPERIAETRPDSARLQLLPVANVNAPVNVDEVLQVDPRVRQWVDTVAGNADTSVAARAPVRQLTENVRAQEQNLRAARAQRYPQIALTSQYQRFSYPAGGIETSIANYFPNWAVSVGLSIPLFTGGRIRGQVMAAEANLAEARDELRRTQELVALDAEVALAQLEQSAAEYAASAGTQTQADRAYQIAEVRYREGLSTQVELADARLLRQQAEINRAQAARDLSVARTRVALLRDLPLAGTGASALNSGSATQQSNTTQPQQAAQGDASGAFTSQTGQP
jgi:outer membrane protein TolC